MIDDPIDVRITSVQIQREPIKNPHFHEDGYFSFYGDIRLCKLCDRERDKCEMLMEAGIIPPEFNSGTDIQL